MALDDGSPIRTLLIYGVISCGFSWSIWGLWATLQDASSLHQMALLAIGTLGPFVAGVVLTRHSDRPVRAWLAGIFRFRVSVRYYAISIALPVFVVGIAASVHLLLFDGTFTPEAVPSTVEYPIYLGIVLLVGGGLEEPGWRGYLLPRLQERYTAFVSALLIGVVWTGWHLPLFAIPGSVQSGLSLWLYVPQVLALSILLTWITNAVGTSVLPAMLLHAGGNAILNYYPIGGVEGAMSTVGLGSLVATLSVVSVAVVVAYGPETLAPDGERWTKRYVE